MRKAETLQAARRAAYWKRPLWRVGGKVKLNVYEGERPVCQCHNARDARRIVDAVNAALARGAQ